MADGLGDFDAVWSLSTLTQLRLRSDGVETQCLLNFELPDLDANMRQRIEFGLHAQASRGGRYKWVELAYQHIQWRFIRYYQYRLRLEALLQETKATSLVLSTSDDSDLLHAATSVCDKLRVQLSLLKGASDPQSSLLPFLASYDLPNGISSLESLAGKMMAFEYRRRGTKVFYQPYNNLLREPAHSAVLTWRRSICFPGFRLPATELGKPTSAVDLNTPIRIDHGLDFDTDAWPGFDHCDRQALASAYSYFERRYSRQLLDRIHASSVSFLRRSGVGRLVLNSDNTGTTRLLARAAKDANVWVDYLPHGLIWEDLSLATGTAFGADRVLAWNDSAVATYASSGRRAAAISHPANGGKVQKKRPLTANRADLRVLIMPPEWVGPSFAGRPDCFERDIIDVLTALDRLSIRHASIKVHNSIAEVVGAKLALVKAIAPFAPISFDIIDSATPTRDLYDRFDLAIIGPTTGLLEASRSTTPFVAFRAMMQKAGLFADCSFPSADTVEELVREIEGYDVADADEACLDMSASLTRGPSPFAVGSEQ